MPTPKALLAAALAALTGLSAAAQVELSAELLVRLTGAEPTEDATSPDLVALEGWLGEARVVGLGESRHGVHDFRRLAHRIFAHLVETQGFDVFALEVSQAHAVRLNDFVHGRRDDLDALMRQRWWVAKVWYDQALRDLLLWMRRYNETAERPVHFAGFDFKQPSFAMAAVVDGLRRLDPKAAAEAEREYQTISNLGGLGVFPNVYGLTASMRVALPARTGTETLQAELMVRGRGVSHGWTGLSLEGAFSGDPIESRYVSPNDLSETWATLQLDVAVTDRVDEVRLKVFHRGNGTVWFDGLRLAIDGREIELQEGLEAMEVQALAMPLVQVMDHEASLDDQVSYAGGRSLRVDCDPALDRALRAARKVDALVDETLAAETARISSSQAAWLRQMSRLVGQATEWRALVESNRDVFMAENLAWLQQHGFPESRVLALAHSSHTNRKARGKGMGLVLAEEYGDSYATVTMLTLSGQLRYFGDPRATGRDDEMVLSSLKREDAGPLEQRLAALGTGDLMLYLRGAAESGTARKAIDLESVPVKQVADVAILLREVGPLRLD